jgi:hypothetical protein
MPRSRATKVALASWNQSSSRAKSKRLRVARSSFETTRASASPAAMLWRAEVRPGRLRDFPLSASSLTISIRSHPFLLQASRMAVRWAVRPSPERGSGCSQPSGSLGIERSAPRPGKLDDVDLWEFYQQVEKLIADLPSSRHVTDSDEIESAIRGGATSGEILGRLSAALPAVGSSRARV